MGEQVCIASGTSRCSSLFQAQLATLIGMAGVGTGDKGFQENRRRVRCSQRKRLVAAGLTAPRVCLIFSVVLSPSLHTLDLSSAARGVKSCWLTDLFLPHRPLQGIRRRSALPRGAG